MARIIGGSTFRESIDYNKKMIVEYLKSRESGDYTRYICDNYQGERIIEAVRKALNELRKEKVITTNDKVYMWLGKFWTLVK